MRSRSQAGMIGVGMMVLSAGASSATTELFIPAGADARPFSLTHQFFQSDEQNRGGLIPGLTLDVLQHTRLSAGFLMPQSGWVAADGASQRDRLPAVGLKLSEWVSLGPWRQHYALTLGHRPDVSESALRRDNFFLYVESEQFFQRGRHEGHGIKLFAWTHSREAVSGTPAPQDFAERNGIGVRYTTKPFHLSAEYIEARGMAAGDVNVTTPWLDWDVPLLNTRLFGDQTERWYLAGGMRIPRSNWEVAARFDVLGSQDTRRDSLLYRNLQLGVQYHFNEHSSLSFNVADPTIYRLGAELDEADQGLLGVERRYGAQFLFRY